jgi:fructokinase
VDVSGIHRADRLPTGTAFVTYHKDGSREFIFNLANSATSLIDADSVDASLTEGCRFFHVMGTSLTSEGMIAAVRLGIQRVKEVGGRVSFDPNIRQEVMSSDFIRDAIDFVLKECDILLPSQADLRYFCGNLAEAEAVHQLFGKWTLERVVVKKAAQGSTYYDRAQSIHVPSFKVTEVDPTGAGDCFGGTLISCLAQGIDLERTLTLANAAGALAVTKRGPMEGNTTLSELEPFITSAERTL